MSSMVRHGWAILDERCRKWDGGLYPTKEAAEETASKCIAGKWSVAKARQIAQFRPAGRGSIKLQTTLIIDR